MSDKVEDMGTTKPIGASRLGSQDAASAVAGAYVLGLLLLSIGAAAIGLSLRDPAFALGLGLVAPAVMLLIGATYARRHGR